jgi:hypothetical protein
MNKCDNYWCEYYDEIRGKCGECKAMRENKDKTDSKVIFRRRQIEQMMILHPSEKDRSYGNTM